MKPAVQYLGVASPSFCACNLMKKDKFLNDLMDPIRHVVDSESDFQWIRVLYKL